MKKKNKNLILLIAVVFAVFAFAMFYTPIKAQFSGGKLEHEAAFSNPLHNEYLVRCSSINYALGISGVPDIYNIQGSIDASKTYAEVRIASVDNPINQMHIGRGGRISDYSIKYGANDCEFLRACDSSKNNVIVADVGSEAIRKTEFASSLDGNCKVTWHIEFQLFEQPVNVQPIAVSPNQTAIQSPTEVPILPDNKTTWMIIIVIVAIIGIGVMVLL